MEPMNLQKTTKVRERKKQIERSIQIISAMMTTLEDIEAKTATSWSPKPAKSGSAGHRMVHPQVTILHRTLHYTSRFKIPLEFWDSHALGIIEEVRELGRNFWSFYDCTLETPLEQLDWWTRHNFHWQFVPHNRAPEGRSGHSIGVSAADGIDGLFELPSVTWGQASKITSYASGRLPFEELAQIIRSDTPRDSIQES